MYPKIIINLDKIKQNTKHAVSVCAKSGIEVVGVTKACLGDPIVAEAMLEGGVNIIGDSRLPNLRRLKDAGVKTPLMMLRLPMLSEAKDITEVADFSLNSDLMVMEALGRAAADRGRRHGVVIMVDMGDDREGLRPEDVAKTVSLSARFTGINVMGLGANVTCLAGFMPTPDQMSRLSRLARETSRPTGVKLSIISGGNSSAWDLAAAGTIPGGVNQLRFGEALLLGRETAQGRIIEGMHQDAFKITTEIIECIPERDSHHIAALGKQDIDVSALDPVDGSWRIIKASSDHLVLKREGPPARPGSLVSFIPGYESLLRAMTSPYVTKTYTREYNY